MVGKVKVAGKEKASTIIYAKLAYLLYHRSCLKAVETPPELRAQSQSLGGQLNYTSVSMPLL